MGETPSVGGKLHRMGLPKDADSEPGLCDQCKALLKACSKSHPTDPNHYNRELVYKAHGLLEDSALEGCCLCQLFLDSIRLDERQRLREDSHEQAGEAQLERYYVRTNDYYPRGNDAMKLEVQHLEPGTQIWNNIESTIEVVPKNDPLSKSINKEFLGVSTGSDQAIDTAVQWIESCKSSHNICRRYVDFLPTRLIDCNSNKHGGCCLVLSSKLPRHTNYTTLSYCWGKNLPVLLLQENIHLMMEEIPVGSLPKTLQDAIFATRQLGKRYLWIDSLCIVQDDIEDWGREAGKMGSVYSGSYCNISATAGTDSSTGLFQKRSPQPMQYLTVKLKWRGKKGSYCLTNSHVWEREIQESPLNQRAWICQERFLSPCNLHFGSKQLFWECGELAANEWYPSGFGYSAESDADALVSNRKQLVSRTLSSSGDDSEDAENSYDDWDKVLRDYTSRKLTYQKDKLVAISGLARIWGSINEDEYLAGLWRKDLETQLLWSSIYSSDNLPNRQYTAPSWSWAAIDGEVSRALPQEKDLDVDSGDFIRNDIEIITARTELSGDDPFGAVTGGSINLKGSLATVKFGTKHGDMEAGTPPETELQHVPKFYVLWDTNKDKWEEKATADGMLDGIFALFVQSLSKLEERAVSGLILASDGSPGVYRRLGYFCNNDEEDPMPVACMYFNSSAKESGLPYQVLEDGTFRYTITLI